MVDFECPSPVLLLTSLVMSKKTQGTPVGCVSKEKLSYHVYRNVSEAISSIGKNLEGKLLTLVDASFQDPEQRKAFKDVLRGTMQDCYYSPCHDMNHALTDELLVTLEGEERRNASALTPFSMFIDEKKLDYTYTRTEK